MTNSATPNNDPDLDQLSEQSGLTGRVGLPKELATWVRRSATDDPEAFLAALPKLVIPRLDYTAATTLHAALTKSKKSPRWQPPRKLDAAFLCGFTGTQLASFLELFLAAEAIDVRMHTPEFGTFRQEILDPSSKLYEHKPSLVVIQTTWRDIANAPALGDSQEAVEAKLHAEFAEWRRLWDTLYERLGCSVVQSNFAPPAFRTLGNFEARHPAGFARFVARLNQEFADRCPAHVTIHDLDHLSASHGRYAWDDARFFHQAKLPCSPENLVAYAYDLSSIVLALQGRAKKCVVLDLDNTLWGGVIGDDGLGGIRLGQGDPEGEAYVAFQTYLKALKERGVLLAVCSKNTESIARQVFEEHDEMVLRLDDVSCFVANWEDKASNVRSVAQQLNIGLDSLVFVDDNPVERSIIRRLCPEVAVPEMPADPADYVEALDRYRYFQTTSLSGEDLNRTAFYQAAQDRDRLAASAADLASFLTSLELVARVGPITTGQVERVAQLVGRSNQFNLTTKRYSAAELLELREKAEWVTRTVSLSDRFGDNGLISVVLAEAVGDALRIDTWLMSCRVLKRGVEMMQLNDLVRIARKRGLTRLTGEYVRTAKNALVEQHYPSLGFAPVGDSSHDRTLWELPIGPEWKDLEHRISEKLVDD